MRPTPMEASTEDPPAHYTTGQTLHVNGGAFLGG